MDAGASDCTPVLQLPIRRQETQLIAVRAVYRCQRPCQTHCAIARQWQTVNQQRCLFDDFVGERSVYCPACKWRVTQNRIIKLMLRTERNGREVDKFLISGLKRRCIDL
jgi:hypothetical protein